MEEAKVSHAAKGKANEMARRIGIGIDRLLSATSVLLRATKFQNLPSV